MQLSNRYGLCLSRLSISCCTLQPTVSHCSDVLDSSHHWRSLFLSNGESVLLHAGSTCIQTNGRIQPVTWVAHRSGGPGVKLSTVPASLIDFVWMVESLQIGVGSQLPGKESSGKSISAKSVGCYCHRHFTITGARASTSFGHAQAP